MGMIKLLNQTTNEWVSIPSFTVSSPYSVGDIVIVDSNTNPGDRLGGTWELVDKGFKEQDFWNTYSVNSGCELSHAVYLKDSCFSERFTLSFSNSTTYSEYVTIDDGSIEIDYSSYGVVQFYTSYIVAQLTSEYNDAFFNFLTKNGSINRIKVTKATTSGLNNNYFFTPIMSIVVTKDNMLDSFCDKFYFRKVSE